MEKPSKLRHPLLWHKRATKKNVVLKIKPKKLRNYKNVDGLNVTIINGKKQQQHTMQPLLYTGYTRSCNNNGHNKSNGSNKSSNNCCNKRQATTCNNARRRTTLKMTTMMMTLKIKDMKSDNKFNCHKNAAATTNKQMETAICHLPANIQQLLKSIGFNSCFFMFSVHLFKLNLIAP